MHIRPWGDPIGGLSAATVMLGVLLLAGPAPAGQASMLDASEASAFMPA